MTTYRDSFLWNTSDLWLLRLELNDVFDFPYTVIYIGFYALGDHQLLTEDTTCYCHFCTRYHRFVLDIIVLYSISSFYTWYYRFVLDIIVLYSISSFCTQYHRLSPHILNYWFIEPSILVITYYCLLHSGLNSLKLSKGW